MICHGDFITMHFSCIVNDQWPTDNNLGNYVILGVVVESLEEKLLDPSGGFFI